ncbi:Cyclin-D1-binding protein 1 homolog [Linum perenne]
MAKSEKERLNQALSSHLSTINDTLQVLDQTPAPSLDKVSWNEVVKLGDQVNWQATIVGMLWTGKKPEAKEIEENMATYFNALQGFLLLSHGTRVGAGPTLSSTIYSSVKQVVDCSFKLMTETVSSYGCRDVKLLVPKLVGAVWESCSALKKTPSTNATAFRRAMTQVAASMKDVLREMKELKPESIDDPISDDEAISGDQEEDGSLSDDDDLGDDLSPEEMKVAELATEIVSQALVFIKEVVRTITGLIKLEQPNDDSVDFVDTLEKLLKLCQGIGEQIDELGACLYPPQEVPVMKTALDKISSNVDEAREVVESMNCSAEAFFLGCNGLKSSINVMESELDNSSSDLETKMQNVSVND